jgi:hypothetical protein
MTMQTKDTVITISRRVIPDSDTVADISSRVISDSFVDLYFLESKAPILLEVKNELKINGKNEELPPLNPYVCNEDSVIMHTTTLKTVEIQAYPLDTTFHDGAVIALIVFSVWYVAGTFNKWMCFLKDLKSCLV